MPGQDLECLLWDPEPCAGARVAEDGAEVLIEIYVLAKSAQEALTRGNPDLVRELDLNACTAADIALNDVGDLDAPADLLARPDPLDDDPRLDIREEPDVRRINEVRLEEGGSVLPVDRPDVVGDAASREENGRAFLLGPEDPLHLGIRKNRHTALGEAD